MTVPSKILFLEKKKVLVILKTYCIVLLITIFIFYTNLNSKKSEDIKFYPTASICFHWKSLLRQIRITGTITKVSDKDADAYYNSRSYGSKIGAWASKQSSILKNKDELIKVIASYKKKYSEKDNMPRPDFWSGWNLNPHEIESPTSTSSPLPNLSDASANLIRGLVWFFKKIIAIAMSKIVGKVIHRTNTLIEEACILSLGKKICSTPSLNLILKSTTSLYEIVLNQY